MTKPLITETLVAQVVQHIQSKTRFGKEKISYELQDDFRHLLLSISVDDFSELELLGTFKKVGALLNSLIPKRIGEYSWMVVFTRKGKVVDSYFGGDLNCPNSGL